MIEKVYKFVCDDCGATIYVSARDICAGISKARANGWAVARDKKHCWCKACAAPHRYVQYG